MKITMDKYRLIKNDQGGQILVFTAITLIVLVMFAASVYNVGMVVGEKMKLQNTADACAYSAAIWEARCFNFLAYTNRAMVAHLVTIAQLTCLYSHATLMRTVGSDLADIIQFIPYVGGIISSIINVGTNIYKYFAQAAATIGIPIANTINAALGLSQAAMVSIIRVLIVGDVFVNAIANANDPNISVNRGMGNLLSLLNQQEFAQAYTLNSDWRRMHSVTIFSLPDFVVDRGWTMPWWVPITRFSWLDGFTMSQNDMKARDRLQTFVGLWGLGWWSTIPPWWDSWGWLPERPIRASSFGYTGIPSFYMFSGNRNNLPSIYVLALKSEGIPQIHLSGIGFNRRLNAIARAQLYYRRPGNPNERPNFFNPFWGAKLAPADALINQLPLGNAGNYLTH